MAGLYTTLGHGINVSTLCIWGLGLQYWGLKAGQIPLFVCFAEVTIAALWIDRGLLSAPLSLFLGTNDLGAWSWATSCEANDSAELAEGWMQGWRWLPCISYLWSPSG